jgi:hypothetical protein
MLVNVALLSAYTFGCHSFRHLAGGHLDCFSCSFTERARYGFWTRITRLNERHQLWAWASLFWVAFTDVYIRFLSQTGITHFFGVPL